MFARAIDFECTGLPSDEGGAAVCEVGWCDMIDGTIFGPSSMLVNPGRPIPPAARAVHHLSDEDVAGAPPMIQGFAKIGEGRPDFFVAHFAEYEAAFFGGGGIPIVCTYKAALRIWPDAPGHALQVLRYWLDLSVDPVMAFPPHRAGPDAYVCAALINRILDEAKPPLSDLVLWTKEPALLSRITFGRKHKGEKIVDVPADYLEWIADKSDLDADTKWNAKRELKRRTTAARTAKKDYVDRACRALSDMQSYDAMLDLFTSEEPKRMAVGITPGTPEYEVIAAAGRRRRAELSEATTLLTGVQT